MVRIWIAAVTLIAQVATAQAGALQAAPLPVPPPPLPQGAVLPPAAEARAVACRDFRNRPVRTIEAPALGDVGRAEFVEGFPVIMLDPGLMSALPANLQTFFKQHECAHHIMGHLFAPTTDSEKEADCWAVREGRKHGLLEADIDAWKPYFAQSRGSKIGHLPGPERVEFLLACWRGRDAKAQ